MQPEQGTDVLAVGRDPQPGRRTWRRAAMVLAAGALLLVGLVLLLPGGGRDKTTVRPEASMSGTPAPDSATVDQARACEVASDALGAMPPTGLASWPPVGPELESAVYASEASLNEVLKALPLEARESALAGLGALNQLLLGDREPDPRDTLISSRAALEAACTRSPATQRR